jgi:hypothetical protein
MSASTDARREAAIRSDRRHCARPSAGCRSSSAFSVRAGPAVHRHRGCPQRLDRREEQTVLLTEPGGREPSHLEAPHRGRCRGRRSDLNAAPSWGQLAVQIGGQTALAWLAAPTCRSPVRQMTPGHVGGVRFDRRAAVSSFGTACPARLTRSSAGSRPTSSSVLWSVSQRWGTAWGRLLAPVRGRSAPGCARRGQESADADSSLAR